MQESTNSFNSFVAEYYSFDEENGYTLKSNLSGSFATALEESYLLPVDILSYAKLIATLLAKERSERPLPALGADEEKEDGRPRQEYAAGRGWFDRTATLDNQVKKGDSKLTALQKNLQHLMSDLDANEFEKRNVGQIVTLSDDRIQHLKPMGVYIGSKFVGIFRDSISSPASGRRSGEESKEDDDGEQKENLDSGDEMSLEAQFREADRARKLYEREREQSERTRERAELESKDGSPASNVERESSTHWSSDDNRRRAESVGWIVRFSRTHNRIYYFNTRTGESVFKEPDI
jgi:hypothetical protein